MSRALLIVSFMAILIWSTIIGDDQPFSVDSAPSPQKVEKPVQNLRKNLDQFTPKPATSGFRKGLFFSSFKRQSAVFSSCDRHDELGGYSISINATLYRDGRLRHVTITSHQPKDLEKCLANQIAFMRFDHLTKNMTANHANLNWKIAF